MPGALDTPVPLQQFLDELHASMQADAAAQRITGLLIAAVADFERFVSAYGFGTGKAIADEFGRQLEAAVRETDSVIRIADWKYAVIVRSLKTEAIAVLAANKLLAGRSPVSIRSEEVLLKARIGIATHADSAIDAEALHQDAEAALLAAVSRDAEYAVSDPDYAARAGDSLLLERELEAAIAEKDFEVHYQPKVLARDFSPCGSEALIRWHNPQRGPISPEVFIPLADRPGRIEPLTSFVLNSAVRHAVSWPPPLSVAVNVSAAMLRDFELVDMVSSALGIWNLEPPRLYIEVTEGALMSDPQMSTQVLARLRDLGVRVSIDDFGTGYSSLAYFKSIPANELKIDKSFVMNMLTDDGDRRIVNAIIQLAKGFGMEVTAEGVEDADTARLLARLGCDRLQGFYFARPQPHEKFLAWLVEQAARRPA